MIVIMNNRITMTFHLFSIAMLMTTGVFPEFFFGERLTLRLYKIYA